MHCKETDKDQKIFSIHSGFEMQSKKKAPMAPLNNE